MRDAVFAKVAQRAVRKAALSTFEHLHRLSLRFLDADSRQVLASPPVVSDILPGV